MNRLLARISVLPKGDFFCEKWLRKNLFISFAEKLQKQAINIDQGILTVIMVTENPNTENGGVQIC